jgi:3',5'-cyclic AMP phosphodiesterase CpdA
MLAHLSDLHVLAPKRQARTQSFELATRLVSFGRALDPERRRRRILRAFTSARRAGATHFVITGDLTEVGSAEQFEALAEVLHDTGVPPDHVVLVPGNHDAYASPHGWRRALDGPLAAFRRNAAETAGKVVDCGGLHVLPIDTTFHQRILRSAGALTTDAVRELAKRLVEPALRDRPVVVAMHHSPFPHASRAWQWIDGLQGAELLVQVLERLDNVDVLHGHLHYTVERAIGRGRPRVFGTTAVVEDTDAAPRFRLHDDRGVFASAPGDASDVRSAA